jgi:hypothetical protein
MKITVCGSIAFYEDMRAAMSVLQGLGHEVKIPELADEAPAEFGEGRKINFDQYIRQSGGIESFPNDHEVWDLKGEAIREHYEKIDWADAIVVINNEKRGVPGYVGGNTLIELGVAFYQRKPIFILNDLSPEISCKQEILGMKATYLDGDVAAVGAA